MRLRPRNRSARNRRTQRADFRNAWRTDLSVERWGCRNRFGSAKQFGSLGKKFRERAIATRRGKEPAFFLRLEIFARFLGLLIEQGGQAGVQADPIEHRPWHRYFRRQFLKVVRASSYFPAMSCCRASSYRCCRAASIALAFSSAAFCLLNIEGKNKTPSSVRIRDQNRCASDQMPRRRHFSGLRQFLRAHFQLLDQFLIGTEARIGIRRQHPINDAACFARNSWRDSA